MLLPVFRDLIKPQWRAVLEALKASGGMPVADLARKVRGSYMTVKTHCEELAKAGYLVRTRLPRTEVGRPEIFYSLSEKADALFPRVGTAFSLDLLEEVRRMFGETAPEKILFQYFQSRFEALAGILDKISSAEEKAAKLASLRTKDGCVSCFEAEPPRVVELHNPLLRIFQQYPRGAMMEQRMMEQLIGRKLRRIEESGGPCGVPRVTFEIS